MGQDSLEAHLGQMTRTHAEEYSSQRNTAQGIL